MFSVVLFPEHKLLCPLRFLFVVFFFLAGQSHDCTVYTQITKVALSVSLKLKRFRNVAVRSLNIQVAFIHCLFVFRQLIGLGKKKHSFIPFKCLSSICACCTFQTRLFSFITLTFFIFPKVKNQKSKQFLFFICFSSFSKHLPLAFFFFLFHLEFFYGFCKVWKMSI